MRKSYLDNIRWMTVVLVVIYHVIYIFCGVLPPGITIAPFSEYQPQDGILYLLYPWFMNILFITAGISSRCYLERHTVREFVRSRTRKLLVPSTIGVLLFGWIQGTVNMEIGHAMDSMPPMPGPVLFLIRTASGIGVLWFAQMLWLFSMILALVRGFEKGRLYARTEGTGLAVLLLLAVPVWGVGYLLNTPVVTVYRFGLYGLVFFLGYFVFAHESVIDRLKDAAVPLIAAAAVLGAVYLFRHFGENYADMPVVNCPEAAAFGWTACLAIFGGMKRWGDREYRISTFMRKRSFGLYVFHYLPLSALGLFLTRHTSCPAGLCYLLTGIAAFIGSWILYEVVSRIPVLRWCVLGM